MNDCTKVKCPFNALTFKDCKMTASECEYHTKQMTNGDMIREMFPNVKWWVNEDNEVFTDHKTLNNNRIAIDFGWWNSPYKRGDTE